MSPGSVPAGTVTVHEAPVPECTCPRHELESWRSRYGIVAGVTGRGPDCDLGLWSPHDAGSVLDRWFRFRDAFGSAFDGIVVGHQIHGCDVQAQDGAVSGILLKRQVDGHVTRQVGLLLAVTVADCVPVYLADPVSKAAGILHVGWRGAASGILEAGIRVLGETWGIAAGDLVMHCGVSICGSCYQVGPEVIESVEGGHARGPGLLDLRANLVERAAELGLADITVSGWCTAHNGDLFYSHRASGGGPGRMAAYVGYPNT